MGSNFSKSNETAEQAQKITEKDIGGNPDPRSPTPEITRTPLQGKNGSKHNITKNVDLRKTFENGKSEEKLIHNNPILSAVIKNHFQYYDPRSPTQDFERTPIVLSINDDLCKRQEIEDHCGSPCLNNDTIEKSEYNKTLIDDEISPELIIPKNLCNGFYDMTINESLKVEEPLGSSTASNEAIEENIESPSHKPSALLETNFDYVDASDNPQLFVEELPELPKVPPPDVKNIPLFRILNEDPRSPSVDIERTPIIVPKTEANESEENVEQMSDDSLIKALQNTNTELRQNVAEKKDGILIYEDEAVPCDTPKKSNLINNGSRTPLSCMKNKTEAAQAKTKSSKDSNTLPKKVSHIPRLKSLNNPTKMYQNGSTLSLRAISKPAVAGDCENTPPNSHRGRWDKESSVVL
ncbi:uncharacterized protein LOC121730215 [Aricia agestis]|uniref:uncharacterized protein LOC121730215 n=1 Tax=Aricia agestis TaxID=91739 RepID=UPI001C202A31|nr:uncharacterized protein LOC121730215 [Aricia agestis]